MTKPLTLVTTTKKYFKFKMKLILLPIFILLTINIFAQSTEKFDGIESNDIRIISVDKTLKKCLSTNEGSTTLGMKQCYLDNIPKMDNVLNIVYKEVLKMLKKDDQEKLKVSQRAWIKFYKAETTLTNEVFRSWSNDSKYQYGSQINVTEVHMTYTLLRERANRLSYYLSAE